MEMVNWSLQLLTLFFMLTSFTVMKMMKAMKIIYYLLKLDSNVSCILWLACAVL